MAFLLKTCFRAKDILALQPRKSFVLLHFFGAVLTEFYKLWMRAGSRWIFLCLGCGVYFPTEPTYQNLETYPECL